MHFAEGPKADAATQAKIVCTFEYAPAFGTRRYKVGLICARAGFRRPCLHNASLGQGFAVRRLIARMHALSSDWSIINGYREESIEVGNQNEGQAIESSMASLKASLELRLLAAKGLEKSATGATA